MSHEHYEGCGHERYGIASDIWDTINGTTPQNQEQSDKNAEINRQREQEAREETENQNSPWHRT